MPNPWDNDPVVGPAQASPFGNRPVIHEAAPEAKTPTPQNPEQRTNTVTNTQRTAQDIAFDRAKVGSQLGESFRSDPAVKAYREVIPQVSMAEQAAPGGPGDISVLYAWAKAMDPTGSVREGDVQLGQSATGPMQRAQFLISQYRLQDGGQLPPDVRVGLIEEMRNKAGQLNHQYSAVHQHYVQLAQQNGVDPATIGEHEGALYRPVEEQYIAAHGGTPRDPANPGPEQAPPPPTVTEKGFGIGPHGSTPTQSGEDFRNELFSAMKSKQIKSTAELKAWQDQYNQSHGTGWSIDLKNPETASALRSALSGKSFNIEQPVPNISDVRGQDGVTDSIRSAAGGMLDTATSGLFDKGAAAARTIFNGGPMDYNLQRQYAMQDYDTANHGLARLGGQVAGGATLPFGEGNSLGQLVMKGAGYGAAYGAGSSRSLSDVPGNAVTGGIAGAAIPAALGGLGIVGRGAIRKGAEAVPPLVDPQTGALNQPLEAMSPGQRVVKAEEYGINLPADAAGGRTAAVMGKGLDINPGSAGVMEDARRATESQVAAASDVVASRFGQSRTMNEAGSELQRGANERIERGKTVVGKAYDAIPIAPTAPASTSNAVSTLQSLTGRFESNPDLAGELKDPKLAKYLGALQKGGLTWQDLKDFRTIIGEKIGEMRFGEGSSKSDLRALYAGLSEDMRTTAAQMGPGASRAFERANSLNRQNEQLVQGALTRILGKDGQMKAEQAAAAVQAMTKGGKSTGDLRTLAQIRAATVKSGAWGEIASTLIRLGGQPANSAGRDFSPQTFVNWYADMAEPARAMLFGRSDLRQALDGFVAVNQRLSKVNALRNTSNTAGGLVAAGTASAMTAPVTMLVLGHPMMAAITAATEGMTAGGGYAMAKAWTNPNFVRWATGYSKAVASGNPNAVKSQVGRLTQLATTNPDLKEPLQALLKRIANDNTVSRVAASPNADDNQKNQSQR
jgi:hypothetical protein